MRIVAIAAGYTFLEVLLLMLTTVPLGAEYFPNPTWYQMAIWFGQLLLIPGMAAVVSRLHYGSNYGWRKALVTLSIVPTIVLPLILVAYLLERMHPQGPVLGVTVLLFYFAYMMVFIFWFSKRMRRRGVQLEAERWLAERRSNASNQSKQRRKRSIRWAVWIPSVAVLLVFLFLIEIWGMLWHVTKPGANLSKHRVPVPVTWFALYSSPSADGYEFIRGMGGRGIARGHSLYHYLYTSLLRWDVAFVTSEELHSPDWMWEDEPVTSQRFFTVEGETVTCLEYFPERSKYRAQPVHIHCIGTTSLRAIFDGERVDATMFYKMIEGIKKRD